MSVTTDSSDGVLRVLPVRLDGQDAADEEREPSVSVRDVQYTDEEVGRGVFALKRLAKSTLVEVAHCIWVPKAEYEDKVSKTVFEHYVFNCKKRGGAMLCLGLGSLFNHSDPPNLDYRIDEDKLLIRFYASRTIEAGEELTIFYGANLWFEDPSGPRRPESPPEDEDNVFSKLML
ncbi:SET domain-containing protein [Chloropicon roscoffensis]|uniref:SET domain-containing protein n=1 Tax=Chloropicon roscoffensis TaxID=1461544 RepID=A0AAX4P700_9CHLO